MKNKINIIVGPTASGKTSLSLDLAHKLDGAIINFDSMQVYKDIPIISAQPSDTELKSVQHELFGIIELDQKFSVATWINHATKLIDEFLSNGKTPILVGGTGMYIKCLMDGITSTPQISQKTKTEVLNLVNSMPISDLYKYLAELDPVSSKKLKPNDKQRIQRALEVFIETGVSLYELHQKQKNSHQIKFKKFDFHIIKIEKPRDVIYKNINKRFFSMIEKGAIEEATNAFNKYGNISYPKAIGLIELISYIKGDLTLNEAIAMAQKLSRNYAKRQLTWIRNQIEFDQAIT